MNTLPFPAFPQDRRAVPAVGLEFVAKRDGVGMAAIRDHSAGGVRKAFAFLTGAGGNPGEPPQAVSLLTRARSDSTNDFGRVFGRPIGVSRGLRAKCTAPDIGSKMGAMTQRARWARSPEQ